MNKITCICLGVKSMERAISFYRDKLGFQTDCTEYNPPVCFFNTPGTKFELYPLDLLAEDIDSDNPPNIGSGFGGITLINCKKKDISKNTNCCFPNFNEISICDDITYF